MGDHGLGEAETARALELARGYLEDAENVLWEASAQADSPERAADLEELTRAVWQVEHAIADRKGEVRGGYESDAEQIPFNAEG